MFVGTVRTTLTIDTEMEFTDEDGVEDIGAAITKAHDLPKKFIEDAVKEHKVRSIVEITDIRVHDVGLAEGHNSS